MSYNIKRLKNKAFVWYIWVKSDFSDIGTLSSKQIKNIENSFANADIFEYVKHGDIIKNNAYSGIFQYNVFFVYKMDGIFKLHRATNNGIPKLFTDIGLLSKRYWGAIGRILEK